MYYFRVLDLVIAILLSAVSIPVMLIICIAVMLDSKGPVFFRQARVGRDLKIFRAYKFRTMKHDEHRMQGSVDENSTLEEKKLARAEFATTDENDSRVTRVGKLLRRTHLDELPQLFNVLEGSMSLVGPRPDVPVQECDYNPNFWKLRHTVTPGITGLAQIDRSVSYLGRRNAADRYWVHKQNVCLYFWTLFATLLKVVRMNSL